MTSLFSNWRKHDKAAAPTSIVHHSLEASPLTSSTSTPDSLDEQPSTPSDNDRITMPMTSPIDIATPTRNSSSSPSSQGQKTTATANFHETDSRTSAMMSGATFDSGMSRSRQDSFAGAKPISMNNPNRNADARPRRESLAGSLVQGMSWGGVSVGSWIRDE
jgi:transcription factor SFP1